VKERKAFFKSDNPKLQQYCKSCARIAKKYFEALQKLEKKAAKEASKEANRLAKIKPKFVKQSSEHFRYYQKLAYAARKGHFLKPYFVFVPKRVVKNSRGSI
jgi:regulator of sigma D